MVIKDRLRVTQNRKKAYTDCRLHALRFGVGDRVFLCVSPIKGVMRFGRKGKLSPRYFVPSRFFAQLVRWLMSYPYL